MGIRVDLTGVGYEPPKRKPVTGAWQKRRLEYYGNYMPEGLAERAAGRWSLTKGASHYDPRVRKELADLDVDLVDIMVKESVTRRKAIEIYWQHLTNAFRAYGRKIESYGDLFHWWVRDVFYPGTEGEEDAET